MILDGVYYSDIYFGKVILYVWGSSPEVSVFTDVYLGWYVRILCLP